MRRLSKLRVWIKKWSEFSLFFHPGFSIFRRRHDDENQRESNLCCSARGERGGELLITLVRIEPFPGSFLQSVKTMYYKTRLSRKI